MAKLVLAEHCAAHIHSRIQASVAACSAVELMEVHFVSATADEELDEIIFRQLDRWVENLPVIDLDGKLLGVINLSDVLLAVMKSRN